MFFSTGYDKDGTCYELVGEDYENYDGSVIRFGIIKNNQWLIEMTDEVPFIDEYKSVYGYTDIYGDYHLDGYTSLKESVEKNDETHILERFGYVGNGCFYLESNSTNKTHSITSKLQTIVFWNSEYNSQKIINLKTMCWFQN